MPYENSKYAGVSYSPAEITARRKELELLTGRPDRNKVISEDEITNLHITLETTQDVSEFIASI